MKKNIVILAGLLLFVFAPLWSGGHSLKTDIIKTSGGNLEITPINHASVMLKWNNTLIHIDPFSRAGDYSVLPAADLILVTHSHGDHLDPGAIKMISKKETTVYMSPNCKEKIPGGIVLANGDAKTTGKIKIEAVPAYSIVNKRPDGTLYHNKGECNGYVLTFADKRVYIAGDTEYIPEMKELKNIDIAFLPVNLPYTMSAEMAVKALDAFKPAILYPYHFMFGQSTLPPLQEALKGRKDIELRIPESK